MTADSSKAEYEARPWLQFYRKGIPPDVEIPQQSAAETSNEATENGKTGPP